VVDAYPERVLIGELYLPIERLVVYYGERGGGVHLPFNFQLIKLPWKASALKAAVDRYEGLLPADAWPNWVLGNHDKSRIASRVGPAQARVAAMILLTLRGTPTLYYGDEIGMRDVPIPPDRVQDPFERNVPGRGFGRDPVRTPMPWEPGPGAGFTTGSPWLPVGEDAGRTNVAAQRADPRSMLCLHQRLLALRRAERALELGGYGPLESKGDVFAFLRKEGRRTLLVALNLGSEPQAYPLGLLESRVLLSTGLDREGEAVGGLLRLRGDEGVVVAVGAG
jgi:alpha-glucosidase